MGSGPAMGATSTPHPGQRPGDWPSLPLAEWQPTHGTLHMWMQVVGKTRLALAPKQNHWWHVTLYVTSRGLTTSPIPYGSRTFDVEFDFLDHGCSIEPRPIQCQAVLRPRIFHWSRAHSSYRAHAERRETPQPLITNGYATEFSGPASTFADRPKTSQPLRIASAVMPTPSSTTRSIPPGSSASISSTRQLTASAS